MVGRERLVNVGRKTYGIKKLINYENRAVYSFFLEQNDHVFNLSLKFLKFVKIKNQNYTQINSLKISFFCLFIQSRTFPKHPTYLCTLMRAQ
jgi:hypothetical protein